MKLFRLRTIADLTRNYIISITTTIDTYSHLYPSKQKDLAEKLDELI